MTSSSIPTTISTAHKKRRIKWNAVKILCFGVWGAVGVGAVGLLSANLQPYALFFEGLIPFAGGVCGKALFLAIQGLEILPEVARMSRSALGLPASFYKNLNTLGLVAMGMDTAFCLHFWPPLKVPPAQLMAGFSFALIDWKNLAYVVFTLFAGVVWVHLLSALVMPHLAKKAPAANAA